MNFHPLTENYVAAVSVPTELISNPSPSNAVRRLLSKREKEHNETLESIRLNQQKYNFEMEEEIQKESDRLKDCFETIKAKIENETRIIYKLLDEDPSSLVAEVFQKVSATVEKYNKQRFEAIDNFYETLKNLERKRSKYFKSVLREGYKKMYVISHVLPYDLVNFFDNEILKINEITMNNYRCYVKNHADLKMRLQEEIRLFHLEMIDTKEKQKTAAKIAKVKGVMDAFKHDDHVGSQVDELTLNILQDSQGFDFPRTVADMATWSKQIKTTLDHVDTNTKKLISLYKMTVINIFHRFFDDLKHITDALMADEQQSSSLLDADYMSMDVYQTVIDDITKTYTCDVADLQKLWRSITDYMESNIDNTYAFLNGSAHLWDAHFIRTDQLKNLVFKDSNLLIEKHDKTSQSFDRKVNTTLDKLRQDSNISLLNQHLQEAIKFLDSIKNMYTSQCDEECNLLQKYWVLINQGIDLLISELDRFLEENAKSEGIQKRRSSWTNQPTDTTSEDAESKFVPHQMKTCQYQVDAVNNWMFGLWEEIRLYMLTCRQELTTQAAYWLECLTVKLKKRMEVRMAAHKPRYLRIKTMIYDVRLRELEEHLKSLRMVEEQVKQQITDSTYITQVAKESSFIIIENYERMMKQIEDTLKNATKSQQVASCIEQSKVAGQGTRQKLEDSFNECSEMITKNQNDVDNGIYRFSDSIKLFIDGGNYSRDEAKSFKKKIQRIKKPIPKSFKKLLQQSQAVREDILKKFDASQSIIMARLAESKKEFVHNETVCSKVKELQSLLRNCAYKMKFAIHRVNSCIDYYADMSKIDIWKRKHFDIMRDVIQECLEKIREITESLAKEDGYLNELYLHIDDSFQGIEKMTKSFYATHEIIINKGKIHGCYENFMKEIAGNYDAFKIQIRIHYLECVVELIKHVLKLLKVNDEICDGLVEKFHISVRADDQNEQKQISRKLSKMSVELEQKTNILKESYSGNVPYDPAVTEIVFSNKKRAKALHDAILTLMECIQNKVTVAVGDLIHKNLSKYSGDITSEIE